jgi:hypothetical protein
MGRQANATGVKPSSDSILRIRALGFAARLSMPKAS